VHRALGLEQLKLFAARRPYRCQALRANLPLSVRHLIGARHDERGLCVGQLRAVYGGEGVPGGDALPEFAAHLHHAPRDERRDRHLLVGVRLHDARHAEERGGRPRLRKRGLDACTRDHLRCQRH